MAAIVSPQLQAVGEPNPNRSDLPNNNNQHSYISQLLTNNSASNSTKLILKPVQIVYGEPTIQFTMEERQSFAVEEGLHQAVVLKLSPRAPDLQVLRSLLPKILSIKGHCLIGHLASRQLLLRLDQPEDFVIALARTVNYFSHSGEQHQYRVFPWTVGYNPKEETSKAAVWISLPNLSPELFARQSLLSIATAVGKPIAIDKATQVKSRPSTARVKVILDLLDKLPTRIRLQHVDNASGKIVEVFQEVIYDNLPGYCINCKRQGHVEDMCRLLLKNKIDDVENYTDDMSSVDKLKGDARDFLNSKRASQLLEDVAKEVGKCSVTEKANGEFNNADARQLKSAEGISDAIRIAGVEQDPLAIEKHDAAVNGTLDSATDEPKSTAPLTHTAGTLKVSNDRVVTSNKIGVEKDNARVAGQHLVTCNDADRANANAADRSNANTIAAGQPGDEGEDTNNNIEVWNMVLARKSPNSKQLPRTTKNAGQDASKIMSTSNYFEALQVMEDGVPVPANAIDRDEQTLVKQVGHLEEGPTKKKVITLDDQNYGIHDAMSRVIELNVGNIDLVKDGGQWGRPLEINGKNAGNVSILCRHIEQKKGDDKESNFKIIEGSCTNEVVGQKIISESTNAGNGKNHVTFQDKDMGVGVFDILKFKDGGHLNLAIERNASTFEKVENVAVGSHGIHEIEGNFLGEGNFVKLINKDVGSMESDAQLIHFGELSTLEKNQKNVGHFDLENEPKKAHGEGSQVEQNSDKAAFGDVASNIGSFSNNRLSNEQIGFQAHSSSVPTLYFSNPQVEQIINDAHNEMTRNTPIFKQPLVTLNTSVFEVPTQSAESIGDFEGASGQQLVSTGNNNEIVMISTGNKNEVHEKQESARKVSYSDCKAVTSSKRRQILMRAAKQKGIASSTSTRSNKSNKK